MHIVRVQGRLNTRTVKGWLIPVDEVFEQNESSVINPHLTLLDDR